MEDKDYGQADLKFQNDTWYNVQSSNVGRAKFVDRSGFGLGQMWVQFKDENGDLSSVIYVYDGIDAEEFSDFLTAPSHGKWIDRNFRKKNRGFHKIKA